MVKNRVRVIERISFHHASASCTRAAFPEQLNLRESGQCLFRLSLTLLTKSAVAGVEPCFLSAEKESKRHFLSESPLSYPLRRGNRQTKCLRLPDRFAKSLRWQPAGRVPPPKSLGTWRTDTDPTRAANSGIGHTGT